MWGNAVLVFFCPDSLSHPNTSRPVPARSLPREACGTQLQRTAGFYLCCQRKAAQDPAGEQGTPSPVTAITGHTRKTSSPETMIADEARLGTAGSPVRRLSARNA